MSSPSTNTIHRSSAVKRAQKIRSEAKGILRNGTSSQLSSSPSFARAVSTAKTVKKAKSIAKKISYPVIVRPSYVLGGRAMKIVYEENELEKYVSYIVKNFGENPILIDKFLNDAIEVDVDALSDWKNVFIAGEMLDWEAPTGGYLLQACIANGAFVANTIVKKYPLNKAP